MDSAKQEGSSRATAITPTRNNSVLGNTADKTDRARQIQDMFWRQTQLNLSLSQFKKLGRLCYPFSTGERLGGRGPRGKSRVQFWIRQHLDACETIKKHFHRCLNAVLLSAAPKRGLTGEVSLGGVSMLMAIKTLKGEIFFRSDCRERKQRLVLGILELQRSREEEKIQNRSDVDRRQSLRVKSSESGPWLATWYDICITFLGLP